MSRISSALVTVFLVTALAAAALGQQPRFSPSDYGSDGATLTVSDSATNREWLFTAEPVDNWADALAYCEANRTADKEDWSLPTILELASLADTSEFDDVSFPHFFDVDNFIRPLLSSTTDTLQINHIFIVNFATRPPGIVETREKSLPGGLAWCVRTR